MTGSIQQKKGFTLVEMLMALMISVSVFMTMNVLLVNATRLWVNGAGQWYLANQARAARARILSGGMGPGSGVLSMDELTSIKTNPNWCMVDYETAGLTAKYSIRGSVENPASKDRAIFIKSNQGGGQTWLMMLGARQGGLKNRPEVESLNFNATFSDDVLTLRYDLSFQCGGRTFVQPQIIRAYLVNL